MCSNQLSYVAIFFSRYLIGVAGRIMRIDPCSVNTFFNENSRNVTVWLGCEQRDRIFGNYWLLIGFSCAKAGQKKSGPAGPEMKYVIICRLTGERLPHVLTDRSWI